MKLIIAVIRPERLDDVKLALFAAGVTGLTISRVSGHGGEPDIGGSYPAAAPGPEFHEKIRLEIAVSDPFVDATVEAILDAAHTGEVGDGKIFIQPLEQVIRIRTAERNTDALTPVTAEEVRRAATLAMAGGE